MCCVVQSIKVTVSDAGGTSGAHHATQRAALISDPGRDSRSVPVFPRVFVFCCSSRVSQDVSWSLSLLTYYNFTRTGPGVGYEKSSIREISYWRWLCEEVLPLPRIASAFVNLVVRSLSGESRQQQGISVRLTVLLFCLWCDELGVGSRVGQVTHASIRLNESCYFYSACHLHGGARSGELAGGKTHRQTAMRSLVGVRGL